MVTSTSSTTAASNAYTTSQTGTDAASAAVYAKVESVMKSQATGVTKLNASLTRDQTKLSGLGQLQSALATFQQAATAMAGKTASGTGSTAASSTAASTTAATTTSETAQGTGEASTAVLGDVANKVTNFVSAYNALNAKLQELKSSSLASDPALSQASSQLAQLVRGSADTAGAAMHSALTKAGVTMDKSGNLQIDNDKLNTAIAADPGAVGKLFTNDGKGLADQMAAKVTVLTGASGRIARETTATTKELNSLTEKKANLTEALTAQANALVAFYTAQNQSGSSGGGTSLFDMMA